MATDPWGIDEGWWGTDGTWRAASPEAHAAARAAMGGDPAADGPPPGPGIVVHRPGDTTELEHPAHLVLEDGTELGRVERLAPDVPLGIHELRGDHGDASATVLASPGRCHRPPDLRTWGLAVQVPTARSRGSWGIGDLADVASLARWVGEQGGGALGLSPLHAPAPVAPLPASPYSPSSRRWRSPLLLRADAVPGADAPAAAAVVAAEAAAARALLAEPIVDRDRCWEHQRRALEAIWRAGAGASDPRLHAWRDEQGPALEGWATWCALAEVHGARWATWPEDLRHPRSPAVAREAAARAERVAFHAWLQLLVEDQVDAVRRAAPGVRLVQDLAIGAGPDGADAWLHQDLLALGVSIGAPPDDFEPEGQAWGLPPFVPWRLRAAGYRPVAELLRAAMAGGGGLRADHVMGLTRLYWVPEGHPPTDGAYVRYAGSELLEVLAVESARAGALVVGEDLGTVEAWLRDELAWREVLSTRVVWFEDEPPERYPEQSEGVLTTHDLPTVAGVWTGADAAELAALGHPATDEGDAEVRRRLDALVGLDPAAPVAEVVATAHRALSSGASQLVLGTLEDLCGVEHRPNVPGTTSDDRPGGWSTALPLPLDDLVRDQAAQHAVEALADPRRPHPTG
jgi:4-alpha-glucanotransferase